MHRLIAPLFASVISMNISQAQDRPQSPDPGSPQRSAILDAARAPAETELGKPVQFVIKQIDVLDEWAFVHATMQTPGGTPFDYTGTRYADVAARGHKSSSYAALLRHRGEVWSVLAYSIGPTDVAWQGWADEYGAPAALFEPAAPTTGE